MLQAFKRRRSERFNRDEWGQFYIAVVGRQWQKHRLFFNETLIGYRLGGLMNTLIGCVVFHLHCGRRRTFQGYREGVVAHHRPTDY